MAMKKREPGFMGLAKQRAKREGMLEVPKRYQPDGGGPEEYPAFVNEQEMAMLKKQGGSGFMTPYGVPSFVPSSVTGRSKKSGGEKGKYGSGSGNAKWGGRGRTQRNADRKRQADRHSGAQGSGDSGSSQHRQPGENAEQYHQRMTGGGGGGGGLGGGD